ncbi:HAD family hydrolase [candidate division KSB1 bacterium]|nr:HAD family hydrolase [candidate division KSB1 bacterium]
MTYRNKRIEAVIFDLDGTLYHQSRLRILMIGYIVLAHMFRPKQLSRVIKIIKSFRIAHEELRRANEPSNSSIQKIQLNITKRYASASDDVIRAVLNDWFYRRPLPLLYICRNRKMQQLVQKLHSEKMKLGLYSDYPAQEKLAALQMAHYFSVITSSYDPDINRLKPDITGFQMTAQKLGVQPTNTIYIGDRLDVDGAGAKNAGMIFEHVNDITSLMNVGVTEDSNENK